jgi:hypothetical protein
VASGLAALSMSACGGGEEGHVSGDALPLVEGASILKSRESPGVTTYVRHLLVQGSDAISATQLREKERSLLERERWHFDRPDEGRFSRFEVQAESPDGEVGVSFTTSHHAEHLARVSGYNFTFKDEARQLRRAGIPALYAIMPSLDDAY